MARHSATISDQLYHGNNKDKGKGVVSRAWRGLAMDGSLWKVIDTTRYYKTIHDDQLRSLGTAASAFLRFANFRGCSQLSGNSLRAIAEHCPNVEHLNLTGCRSVSSKSIADVCMNMPALLHLDLSGLLSVNNYTLQAMAVYCRSLQVLNLAWCKQISGAGLSKLTRSCQDLRKLNVSGCSGLEDRWMPVMGMNLPKLRELCLNNCSSLTDRGLIGLLSGLSLASSKKHRKWRVSRRMASSVRVSSLGHLLVNQSSCNDDDDDDDDEDNEDDDEEEQDEALDKEDEEVDPDSNNSDVNDLEGEEQSAVPPLSSPLPQPLTQTQRRNEDELQAKLNYLGLSNCHQLTLESLRAIGHYCHQHLRRLELSGCENIGDEGLVMLAQNCTKLRLLDLEDVSLLTDVSLRAFGLHLQHLERISLSNCENVTDQGIMRMLRPAPNPTTLSTATAMMMNNPEGAASCCRKLLHIELDNCVLLTDRLLLEFANVLEERKAAAMERQRERERKRAERRERLRQRMRESESIKGRPLFPLQQRQQPQQEEQQQREMDPSPRSSCDQRSGGENDATPTAGAPSDMGFVSSSPVNIPDRLRRRHPATLSSGSLSFYSSSPLQPRSVLASTSVSEEVIAIKKTHRRARRGVLIPTRSDSSTSTTSNCSSSSTSLPLWSTATTSTTITMNSRGLGACNNSHSNKYGIVRTPPKRVLRPVMQVFDCRNITLEGVEAARERCSTLAIKSYYSLTHPSTAAPASAMFGSGGAFDDLGGLDDGDDDEDEDEDDDDSVTHGYGGSNAGRNGNTSQTSLHHLQMQHQHLQQQLQQRSRASQLFHRARVGLLGRAAGGGNRDSQCHIL
ncbi:hypothetical protein EC968_002918 [Mortierella alpina]|nr:hypothetical protein EC968_002918 [Mortierella alpina]